MTEGGFFAFTFVAAAGGLAVIVTRAAALRQRGVERLSPRAPEAPAEDVAPPIPFVRKHPFVPWTLGAIAGALVTFAAGLPVIFGAAALTIVGALGAMVDKFRVDRLQSLIETQLADAIDLMVGTLRAGSSLLEALEAAARESERPLKDQLLRITEKVRLGDDPQSALDELTERVPLHSFRLFALTLSVNWEVGGSLAPGLGAVGRAIRDRTELVRRVRAQSTQARVSVVGILGITYFLALLLWRADPARMEDFVRAPIGTNLIGLALVMQAIGLVWMSRLSEIDA